MKLKTIFPCALITILPLTTVYATAAEGQWKYTSGFDYSSGNYGGDPADTDITYVPFSMAYSKENWTFKGTISWLQMHGPGTVIGGADGGVIIRPDPEATTVKTESGMGDLWLGTSYLVDSIPPDLMYVELGGKVKLPTADEDKGLGTGETDYTVQADFFKPMKDFMPFATVAYKIKGDPSGYELKNVFYLSAGSDFKLFDSSHIGLNMDYQQASTDTGDDVLEAMGYLNQKLGSEWSMMLYLYKGLADGSPDYGGGLQLSFKPKS